MVSTFPGYAPENGHTASIFPKFAMAATADCRRFRRRIRGKRLMVQGKTGLQYPPDAKNVIPFAGVAQW